MDARLKNRLRPPLMFSILLAEDFLDLRSLILVGRLALFFSLGIAIS